MRLIMGLLITLFLFTNVLAKHKRPSSGEIAELYSKIGRKLAAVKKLAPDAKVSSVLDDIDRLKEAADSALSQDSAAMSELETRTLESSVLEKELLAAKQENESLRQSMGDLQLKIVVLGKDVERERAQVALLKEQNAQLIQKGTNQADLISAEISKIDKQLAGVDKAGLVASSPGSSKADVSKKSASLESEKTAELSPQNLNLTSTSDPSSPR
jgi:chromosome segregation ATPase